MRCLPIIFGIDFNKDIPILFGSFCKFAFYSNKNNWPIIAQEQYFESFSKYNEVFLDEVYDINEIGSISDDLLSSLESYKIASDETQDVIDDFGDKEKTWIRLMNEKSPSLYKILDNHMKQIVKKHDDIKAIIVWRHNHTISLIAKKYGLKMIEMELSGVRRRAYNFGLSYFQFSKKYSRDELEKRYEKFRQELKKYKKDLPCLNRYELLGLILTKDKYESLENKEMYDFGIALGLQSDFETISSESITNEQILSQIINIENPKNILIRKHPLDANYKYPNEDKFDIDNSKSSIDFVTKCHRIVSSVSNINFEAMILGKTCYTLGNMPFAGFSYDSLKYNDDYVINIYDLNFLFFCYYVPYSLCLDEKYIEFRLSNPSEIDIYLKNYNYINEKYKKQIRINFDRVKIRGKYLKMKENIESLNKNIIDLNSKNEELTNEKKAIMFSYQEAMDQINDIINSKSWKLTKPLRKFQSFISKLNK